MSKLLTYGIMQQKKKVLLLDTYTGAAAAFSLRKLRTDYAGYCIKVRRSSDNSDQDIGFVNGMLDETSLLSFVGANNGIIRVWYDQSGNGNDLTVVSYQGPRIVNSGVVDKTSGYPNAVFTGVNESLDVSIDLSSSFHAAIVQTFNNISYRSVSGGSDNLSIGGSDNINWGFYTNGKTSNFVNSSGTSYDFDYLATIPTGTITVQNIRWNSSDNLLKSRINGNELKDVTSSGSLKNSSNSNTISPATIFEVILWPDRYGDRIGIESNMKSYYTLSDITSYLYNPKIVYAFRIINSNYSGKCIKVRRSSDDTTQDIGFSSGILDESALTTFVGANDGFVHTWYDQSGMGFDATQTTNANQPKIVSSGTVIKENLKPTLDFGTSSNQWYLATPTSAAVGILYSKQALTYIHVARIIDYASSNAAIFGQTNTQYDQGLLVSQYTAGSRRTLLRINGTIRNDNSGAAYQLWADDALALTEIFGDSSSVSAYNNGTSVTLTDSSAMPSLNYNNTQSIGYYYALANNMNGKISELIIYTTNIVSNRSNIESNINSFYSIY